MYKNLILAHQDQSSILSIVNILCPSFSWFTVQSFVLENKGANYINLSRHVTWIGSIITQWYGE